MKKNDILSILVYAVMIGAAAAVAFGYLRPMFSDSAIAQYLPINGIAFVLLITLASLVLNALFVELGHLIGAKVGKYKIVSWNCLFFALKRGSDDKFRFSFSSFDGLTGETVVTPKDVEKSSPRAMIYFPLLFLLLEVIAFAVVIAFADVFAASSPIWHWWKAMSVVALTVAGMIYLYQIFPAPLDNKNDGYVMTIVTNKTNKKAYNQMLLAQHQIALGLEVPETVIYDEVTDFTAKINDISLFKALETSDYKKAIEISEKTIKCEKSVSSSVYHAAVAQKLSLMVLIDDPAALDYYKGLGHAEKKYIADFNTIQAARAFILVSGLLDKSVSETKNGFDLVDKVLSKTAKEQRPTEERIIREALRKIRDAHQDWDLSAYDDGTPAKDEPKDEPQSNGDEPKQE